MEEYHNWEPLSEIAAQPWCEDTLGQLQEWSRKSEKNSFPAAKETLGRFVFYDMDEVKQWYTLWKKATRNFTGGEKLNGTR